jgi:hypothetical protein
VLVITAGILQMSEVRENIAMVRAWASQLEGYAAEGGVSKTIIYMGTHHRIAELTPATFRSDADGLQGNARFRLWTSTVRKASKLLKVVDPYKLTSGLDARYRDTEDGLHFGQWINLQKFQRLLLEINGTSSSK